MCEDVSTPREICNQVPEEECKEGHATITKYQDEEDCQYVPKQICDPVTRTKCDNIKENVPKQTYEERCETEYVEECSYPDQPHRPTVHH